MATRKRNEWLEADLDEADDDAYNSSLSADESRNKSTTSRTAKRRRLSPAASPSSASSEADDDDDNDDDKHQDAGTALPAPPLPDTQAPPDDADAGPSTPPAPTPRLPKKAGKARDASTRSGVVYLSRVPPFMKPATVAQLLGAYAPSGVGRVFLTPEGAEQRQARVRGGGNKKRRFTDGWVEFAAKEEAKVVVETLNARTIGGRRTGYYVDDVWNLRYLRGFKWRHLTEQITNENAERAARMRAEGQRDRREVREFLRNVERSKIEETRSKKREAREKKLGAQQSSSETPKVVRETKDNRSGMRQNKPLGTAKHSNADGQPEEVNRVLSKIF